MSNTPRNLLQIVNAAQDLLGLPRSVSVVGNTTDFVAIQMLSLAQEVGEEIRDWPDDGWTAMQVEFNLAVVTPVTTTGNTTVNSAVITNIQPNTSGITAGASAYQISGNSIPIAARIVTINSSSSVTMDMEATGASTSEAILFVQDTYTMPSDFRYFENRTMWDRTNHWELIGPDSPQMDQWHRSGIVALGPRRHFRKLGHATNTFRLWPPPSEIILPIQLVFEYSSTDWVNVNGTNTTTSATWTSDTDTPYLDDRALIKGLVWKYAQMKGIAYSVFRNDFIDWLNLLVARDTAAPTLSLSKRIHSQFVSPSQVVDGNFPGFVGPNSN